MNQQALEGGFTVPAVQSAQAFRCVMEAMARPGTLYKPKGAKPPAPMSPAAGAVVLTLCDSDTPVHLAGDLDCAPVREWITFHASAPLVPPQDAIFAIGTWADLAPLDRFAIGTPEYPDRSATLIVELPVLNCTGATLNGPGIATTAQLSLPETLAFQRNRELYPLGLDFFFTHGAILAALPRSTEVS